MNTSTVNESVIQKIKKLIEKSQTTDSLEEAESFMIQAQKLLQKYNLEQSVVESHVSQSERGEQITETTLKYYDDFETSLMNYICNANFSKCIMYKHSKNLKIIGKTSNIEVCIYLFNFFKSKLRELSLNSYNEKLKEIKKILSDAGVFLELDKKFKKSFDDNFMPDYILGAVHGVGSKMIKTLNEATSIRSLVLYNDKQIQLYIDQNIGKLGKSFGKRVKYSENYMKGYNEGRAINPAVGISQFGTTKNIQKCLH